MLKYLPSISKTMTGMGVLMENERPVVRFMSQHWPLTAITGYALYRRLRSRHKDKSLSAFTALTDSGLALAPLAVVAIISMAAAKRKEAAPRMVQPKALPAPAEVSGFAGSTPPPAFFATRPPHEADAAIPAPAEQIVTKAGPPPSQPTAGGGMFDSFLS